MLEIFCNCDGIPTLEILWDIFELTHLEKNMTLMQCLIQMIPNLVGYFSSAAFRCCFLQYFLLWEYKKVIDLSF